MSPVPTDAFFAVVPASSANVGCAFDSAAIALGLYLRVSAAPKESGWELSYSGANADQILHDRTNLFVKAMERAAAASRATLPYARLDEQNETQVGFCLGTIAVAMVRHVSID